MLQPSKLACMMVTFVLAVVASGIPGVSASTPTWPAPSSSWTDWSIGDTVATGTSDGDGNCDFAEFVLEIVFTDTEVEAAITSSVGGLPSMQRWADFDLDTSTCEITILDMGETFEPGVPGNPPEEIIPGFELGVVGPVPPSPGDAGEASDAADAAAAPTKCLDVGSQTHTHTYNNKNSWLTSHFMNIRGCYDGAQAWSSYRDHHCVKYSPHQFNIDACDWQTYVTGPGPSISTKGYGKYHQTPGTPPSGDFYHTLGNFNSMTKGGGFSCSPSYQGSLPPIGKFYCGAQVVY
jgi:hypothetical protein